jgi:pimeloyl-ACP methyl ester carboxylesterase
MVTEKNADAEVTVRSVRTPHGRVNASDRDGDGPAVVLMHGFPDDSRIYDLLTPELSPQRSVALDFVGHGHSERPKLNSNASAEHTSQLGAVLDSLGLDRVTLVGHDAGGPVAIDYALSQPHRVGHLVLLNTYYGRAPALRFPEMISLFADDKFTPLSDAMMADDNQRLWLINHTGRQFGADPLDPKGVGVISVFPQFFGDDQSPNAVPAIRSWTAALSGDLDRQDERIASGELRALEVPVTLLFGVEDRYLSLELAYHIAGLFHRADLHGVEDASHWPQWDQPSKVAQMIKELTVS